MAATEGDLQAEYFDFLKTVDAPGFPFHTVWDFAYAVPNGLELPGGPASRGKYMNRLKRQGLKPGVSDVCIALPVGRWHGAYLELKRNAKSVRSDAQKDWVALMRRAGYYAEICAGAKELARHTATFLAG